MIEVSRTLALELVDIKHKTILLYLPVQAVMKYHLKGEKAGREEKILDEFPGVLDGVDCSKTGKCYVAMPTTVSAPITALFSMPSLFNTILRTFLLMLPRNATPDAEHYGGFAEIYPGSTHSHARILRVFQDPDGSDIDFITGVTEFDGKVYLGSLHNDYVGVYDLT